MDVVGLALGLQGKQDLVRKGGDADVQGSKEDQGIT